MPRVCLRLLKTKFRGLLLDGVCVAQFNVMMVLGSPLCVSM